MNASAAPRNRLDTVNPGLVQLLGLCPLLALGTTLATGTGLALTTLSVLVAGNAVASFVGRRLPPELRIAVYLLAVTGTVSAIELAMAAWWPELHDAFSLFLPLIVANCLVLARPDAFATHHALVLAVRDGVALGVGFGLVLVGLGAAREFQGNGLAPALLAPGVFIVPGVLLALRNRLAPARCVGPAATEPAA